MMHQQLAHALTSIFKQLCLTLLLLVHDLMCSHSEHIVAQSLAQLLTLLVWQSDP